MVMDGQVDGAEWLSFSPETTPSPFDPVILGQLGMTHPTGLLNACCKGLGRAPWVACGPYGSHLLIWIPDIVL